MLNRLYCKEHRESANSTILQWKEEVTDGITRVNIRR